MRYLSLAASALLVAVIAVPANASAAILVPQQEGWVTDPEHVLAPAEAEVLSRELADIKHTTKSHDQVALLITPSLQGTSIESYSIQVARTWALGQKGADDGVLVVIAPHERKMRIDVGYRLEGALTDARSKLIIANDATPHLAKGSENYFLASQAAIQKISAILKSPGGQPMAPRAESPGDESAALGVMIIFFVVVIAGLFFFLKWRGEDEDEEDEEDERRELRLRQR